MKKKKPRKSAKDKRKARERADKKAKHTKWLEDQQMLHFARTHQPLRDKICKDASQCNKCMDYAANTESGTPPATMNNPYEAAAHHILPVAAVAGFTKMDEYSEDGKKNIASVYAKMEWCINMKSNLMWLPYFPAYQRHLTAGRPGSAPQSLAAHNFDHNPHYNKLVIKQIQADWDAWAVKKPSEKCKKNEALVKTLTGLITDFKNDLTGRKTQRVVDKAHELRKEGKNAKEVDQMVTAASSREVLHEWWKAFSMAPGSTQKKPSALLVSRPPSRKAQKAIKSRTESAS